MFNEKFNLQMFAEEGEEQQTEQNEPKQYTQEDIDKMITTRLAQAEKKAEKEKQKAIEEALSKANEQREAEKLKNMSDTERQQEELKALKSQLEELKLKDERAKMATEVRKQLAEKNITVDDSLVEMIVSTDAETTKSRLEAFIEQFEKSVDTTLKTKLKGKTPKTGTTKPTMSKEEIMQIRDRTKRQKLIAENYSLFTGGN